VRDRRRYLLLSGMILALLVGALLVIIPGNPAHKNATLGLDLRGGLEVVLKAVPPPGKTLTSDDLDRSINIMRDRIDKLGVSEPEIRKQEPNQIVIQLAGIHDPAAAAKLIGQTAQLELYDLEGDLRGPSINAQGAPVATTTIYDLLSNSQTQSLARKGAPTAYFLYDAKKRLLAGPVPKRSDLFTSSHPKLRRGERVLVQPAKTVILTCGGPGTKDPICPGGGDVARVNYYLFKHNPAAGVPELTGRDLNAGGTKQDFDPNTNSPIVRMSFTDKGDHRFQDVTRRLWQRGNLRNTPQHFAIVLDNDIRSFPQIDPTDSSLSDGISGGAQITGISSLKEAQNVALVLSTGALPVSFQQIERTDVSATLGKDSLQEAKTAALVGLLIVALFLLVLYRFLGLVAVAGLAIYAAFLYAAVLLLGVTITLPGFAGLILTIGVAADANVVIFERIKEEVRAGKSIRGAIATGYQKGFHTIIDANVVTVITALVLFAVATAQVKGFALMLLIGTVISLLTAVVATRAMLGLLAGFRWFSNPKFIGVSSEQHGKFLQLDFMGKRRLWFAISGVVILVSVVSLIVQGLNFGIDFRGGTQVAFSTSQPVSLARVRAQTDAVGRSTAEVQGRGPSFPRGSTNYKSFQLRMKSLSNEQQNKLTEELKNIGATTPDVKTVSSSFSGQIRDAAILAICVSLALIAVYITLRFDWKYAVPVLVALAHDILITIGVYSLSQREVTTATIAAVLTVLGYSIYDTIIIFDRIRENTPQMRRASFATIANISLWETIRRSLATTFITLLPIGSLLIFGGATLQDFAFALLIGILSGAYSSIFIAAPLLTSFKEREPEYRRRIGADVVEAGVGGMGAPAPAAVAAAETDVTADDVDAEEEAAPTVAAGAAVSGDGSSSRSQAKREKRRQRRRTRPHGRAR